MYFERLTFVFVFLYKKSDADPGLDLGFTDGVIKDFCVLELTKFGVPDSGNSKSPYSENECFNAASCSPDIRYRTIDGTCNNVCYPNFGAAGVPYRRNMSSRYFDGIYTPAKSKDGSNLPLPRAVRVSGFPDGEILDTDFTVFLMQYGQGVAHDILSSVDKTAEPGCPCLKVTDVYMPIEVPKNDSYFSKCGVPSTRNCMEHIRSNTSPCAVTKDKQITNFVTSFIDLSYVYGSDEKLAKELRLFKGGLLKYQTINDGMFLPKGSGCLNCGPTRKANYCFSAGDGRANMHPMLIALHTLYLREHNRLAEILAKINPEWDDETLYQEAKEINSAIHQIITYREWLPIIIGNETMTEMDMFPKTNFCGDCTDCDIDATTVLSFNTGCFRYYHTTVRNDVLFYDGPDKQVGSIKLSDTFFIPDSAVLRFDELVQGMIFAPMQKADTKYSPELTQKLSKNCSKCGDDLISKDIQRQRDHGIQSYNAAREYCGFPRACTFDDFADYIKDKSSIEKLKELYKHPDDVDLLVGSSLEDHVPGALIGPTCKKIMALQFKNYICGDRYWFPKYFSMEQAKEVFKITAAHLICNNANVKQVPKNPFRTISLSNPLVDCSCLDQPNFKYWFGVPRIV